MSLETRDQKHMDRTEVEVAVEYANIAAEYEVPITLFVTGKAVVEETERVRELAEMPHVELGGHGYYAFDTALHTAWRALEKVTGGLAGSWNGPRQFQQWEIRRTKAIMEELGADVKSWRDHAYRHDENTAPLLAREGITHFSDTIGPTKDVRRTNGVTTVPVNTPPDHEHVYHAFRRPGSDSVRRFEGPFGGESVEPDKWVQWVIDQAESVQHSTEAVTILAHPSCLWLANEFESFERLCEWISEHEPSLMRDVTIQEGPADDERDESESEGS